MNHMHGMSDDYTVSWVSSYFVALLFIPSVMGARSTARAPAHDSNEQIGPLDSTLITTLNN